MISDSEQIGSLFDLRGRSVLFTGATGHLGPAMASALAEAGARLVVTSRRAEQAKAAADKLPGSADIKHVGVALDHMEETSLRNGFESAVAAVGKLDALVCNAHEVLGADWRNVTAEQFNRQLGNATGYFLLARLFRDHVAARKAPGSIVLLGSMYGLVGSYPAAYEGVVNASPVAYHALKGGIAQMTRHLAVYWAKDNVRVNCLSPGPFPGEGASSEMVRRLSERSPLGRMGRPHELKGPLVFLVSDASSYMTGQNLVIDGGWTAW